MSDIWVRWGALTKSLISTRIAVERERALWDDLEVTEKAELRLRTPVREAGLTVVDHVEALDDESTVLTATFVLSYALAEAAALNRLGIDFRAGLGVEEWGTRLLLDAGRTWSDVPEGLSGAVEVAVVRNLILHGQTEFDVQSCVRLATAGNISHAVGDPVVLDYAQVELYRGRLLDLLTVGGLGD
ncbi:hypothetical protein [Microbacterium aoyamense]|uniref:hypothetical protein n=1 Tax=Microbacterium aoyamense TaxID=344166 RepID=UPI0020032788|nr:hypothetical protein [Microbacterium aoyamense]